MSDQEEFEGEIEFLDEDAEIVQQCVRIVENDSKEEAKPNINTSGIQIRENVKQATAKRKRKEDDDSDYDPREENIKRKKRQPTTQQNVSRGLQIQIASKPLIKKDPFSHKMDLVVRRKLHIKVPDYDDPLCLPVRTLRKDNQEKLKLKNWNNLCLEQFKNYDTSLRVDKQPTVSSKRILVFKNVYQKDKVETIMSAKVSVENKNGQKKTEVLQSVLPKYREKKLLSFRLAEQKRQAFYTKDEVLLTKEVNKGEETLVAYKPMESLSLVYKMFENNSEEKQLENEEDNRKHLKEVGSCKMCAPCYQMSYRAVKVSGNRKVLCMICKRPCISTYNMLAHMKSHPAAAVRACKKKISKCLATAVEYHYKCRICQEKFLSIKSLRSHVRNHKGTDPFKCEVCNKTFL